jgi:hypothetical protein
VSRPRRPQLVASEWLVERAATDDPPTELGTVLLARFARVGVTELSPVTGTTLLDVGEAELANAIAARGPGIAFAESWENEAAPIGGALERLCTFVERFDRLRALRFAASDMRLAGSTARALARSGKGRHFRRQLETALVVIYARPYLPSNGLRLGGRWRPVRTADRELHDRIIDELRDPYHAHADRTGYRTLIDMSGEHGPGARSRRRGASSATTTSHRSASSPTDRPPDSRRPPASSARSSQSTTFDSCRGRRAYRPVPRRWRRRRRCCRDDSRRVLAVLQTGDFDPVQ